MVTLKKRCWTIEFSNTSVVAVDEAVASQLVTAILLHAPHEHIPEQIKEVSVRFTDDSEIQAVNCEYRSKNSPTDVLSFSQIEGLELSPFESSLGDILISLETAERQAEQFGNTFAQEVLRLLVHGILHLLGFEHENVSPEEVKRMQDEEDRLFMQFSSQCAELLSNTH